MAGGFFVDRAETPDDTALSALLGDAASLWRRLEEDALEGAETAEWKFSTKKTGWVRIIRQGKRALFYMIPDRGSFVVSFVFGEKAAEAVMASEVSAALKEKLAAATPYVEGRGLEVEMGPGDDLAGFRTLLDIKRAK